MESDIAVFEYRTDQGDWEPLAYIGPDRKSGTVEEYYEGSGEYRGCDLRIRYLDRDN